MDSNNRWKTLKRRQLERCEKPELAEIVERNIRLIDEHHQEAEREKSFQDHVADWLTGWAGSMSFVWLHAIWFGVWILWNEGGLGVTPFDPFPYGLLTTIVSLEAIFLSTFVLVSQNRQGELADRRSELDLQINLLTEYELTRALTLIDRIAKKMDVTECDDDELEQLEQDVEPEAVLRKLEKKSAVANPPSEKLPTNAMGHRLATAANEERKRARSQRRKAAERVGRKQPRRAVARNPAGRRVSP